MFEISHYLISPSLASLMIVLGTVIFVFALSFFVVLENKRTLSYVFALPALLLIAAIPGAGICAYSNPVIEAIDNPVSYVKDSPRERLRINEEEFRERVSSQLEVDNVNFQIDGWSETLHSSLRTGDGVAFTAVRGTEAINGVVHFTDESMVITVFEKSDETIIVPTDG